MIIGSHVSYNNKDGLLGSVLEAISYKANTFMVYTGAPQNTIRSNIDFSLTKKAHKLMDDSGIDINNVIAHAPYIVNLANRKDEDKYLFMVNFLKKELERCEKLGINKIVLHPGSHVGLGVDEAILNITSALNMILDNENGVIICLETMAGKGTEVGRTFEQLKEIIDGVKYKNRVMVCLDTCHINDAGYDLSDFDNVLEEFDRVIGIDKIACVHLNDSKNECRSQKDRHANIGYGTIGFDNLIGVLYHAKLKEVPFILETPYINKKPPYKYEIEMLRSKKFNDKLFDILD